MLVDPMVLKKQLNRMATEQGAFAVLSSLLLYVTELAAVDPQLSHKRTKWAEGKENKVSSNQPCPDPNRGQRLTRFQLLRARFLNNNREPYTKKRREVGKLVIKEKLWVSKTGNKPDRKADGKAAEEGAYIGLSERARWSCASRKNTVKDILKKFLAAEEKEAKEKSPSWKKGEPNRGLPKIVNRSSVLSKLKEKFEQSAVCSAAEVKASLSHKGKKKTKNIPSRKKIHKPEVRVLCTAAMTATGISSPESQYLVCSTVPLPRLNIATKINHPWRWSKNSTAKQPFGPDTPMRKKGGFNTELSENKTLANAAQDMEDKEEISVAPETMSDAKICAEASTDSTKQGPNFNSNLDSSSTTHKNKALVDCTPPLPECSLNCDRNNMPSGPDISSLLGNTSGVPHDKEDRLPSNSPYFSTAKGSHKQNIQNAKTGEIPEITMYVYSSEEADTELTELEEDTFFAGQKCFPEQKALENILPFHSPRVQASWEVEPSVEDQQLIPLTPASGKRPLIAPKETPGLRGRCSEEVKEEEKHHSEGKISSTSNRNDSDVPIKKEEENKTSNSQMQNDSKTKQPQPPQIPRPQNNFGNSNADMSNPDAIQTKPTVPSNESQEHKLGAAEEEDISSHLEKTQSPLPDDLVKHSSYIAEDLGKEKLSSSNETMNHANNQALHRSTLTDLETCHKSSKNFIEHEEAIADEMPHPDSEAWQLPSPTPLPTPMSGIAEQRFHHTLGNPPALSPPDVVSQGADGVEHEHASQSCKRHPPLSSDELTNCSNNTTVEKKTECDFKNQVLSPNHTTEDESSTTEETNTCQRFENYLSLSTKKPGKYENKNMLSRKPLLPLEKNKTLASDDTTKQGNGMLQENTFPSSPELVSDQKDHEKCRINLSKHKKDRLLSSADNMKHENDRMETEEREERNVLHKSEEEQVFILSDGVNHDNNSSDENNVHRPQTCQLPSSEHDTNIQGMKKTKQSLKHLTPSKDFVKHKHDMTVDENTCCNDRKDYLSSSNEIMKHADDSSGEKTTKSDIKNYSVSSQQENKSTDEENTPHNLKDEPVQHKKSCEGERNTLCDHKNQIPLLNPSVKQDKRSSPPETWKQMSPGDFVTPETESSKKNPKLTSEKLQSPSSNKVPKPQERSSSGERKQKTPAAEGTRSPEPKAVKADNEHQHSGKYQLPPSRKSAKHEEKPEGGDKQQMRCRDLMTPDTNVAKEKNKFPSSRNYQPVSSEILVKPQEKNSPEKKQQTSVSAIFKKKDEDPNSEKSHSSKEVEKFKEKNTPGDRKQKTPTTEDIRSPEAKSVKEKDKHQCSGKHQLPPSTNSSKPEKNTPGGEKQKTMSGSFTKPDVSDAKDKSKDLGSGMCQSSSSNSLVKPQERNTTSKKKQISPPLDEKTMYKTDSPKKKNGSEGIEKYQLHLPAQSEKHSNDGSGKEGSVSNFKICKGPLPTDGINCESNTVPKKTSVFNTKKSPKSSSFHVASKDDGNPAGNRKSQPGFKKYQALSSKNLVRHEKDVTERKGSRQAAGKTSEKKAELEDCSKVASFSKYTVESHSEGPLDSSFKPFIIRIPDTFKHHS